MTLAELIDLASSMERKAYAFYDTMEKRFQGNEKLASIFGDIKKDEKLHLRILQEIRSSLPDFRLGSPVQGEAVDKMQSAVNFLDNLDMDTLKTSDDISNAIRTLETVEFDVVMTFVDTDEIEFEFTREYLRNESVDHTNRIYEVQRCLD